MKEGIGLDYPKVRSGTFIDRPNRFIARVEFDGGIHVCHVKNTGRCRELLIPGVTVFTSESANENRKTKYDLISVVKGDRIINIDSQSPNKVFYEWMMGGNLFTAIEKVKPEARFGNSRFDFYVEADGRRIFIEVKGVTLECGNMTMFPDAPTTRGRKHVEELRNVLKSGFDAYVVFVVQLEGVDVVMPNYDTDEPLASSLKNAARDGVNIIAIDSYVGESFIRPRGRVKVDLEGRFSCTSSNEVLKSGEVSRVYSAGTDNE
jgi:sugar fermentation stimulation protein A